MKLNDFGVSGVEDRSVAGHSTNYCLLTGNPDANLSVPAYTCKTSLQSIRGDAFRGFVGEDLFDVSRCNHPELWGLNGSTNRRLILYAIV